MTEPPRRALAPSQIGALVALVAAERLGEAESSARALLAVYPNAGMLWKILGVALMRQDKDAMQALRRTTELMPNDAEAHANLGAALHDRRQWAESLTSLRRALELQPNDVDSLINAAAALTALGRASESVPLYRRALEIDPRRPEAHNNLGNAFLHLRRHGDAVGCYRRALQLTPDDAQIHCNLGNAQRQLGALDEALSSAGRAVALDPTLSVAHNNLGLILAALGRREEAVVSYRKALALHPGYVDALNNLGNAVRDLGRRREAASLYATAIELAPARAESHCNLGNVLMELQRVDAAMASYRQALVLRPDDATAHTSLSAALRQKGRAADAEASCQAALAIDPNAAAALSALGELRADRGRFSEAEELFRRAIAIDPDCPAAYVGIASSRKMTRDGTGWQRDTEALLAKPLPLGQEIALRYALGKYFDDIEEYDQAFGNYRQANELTKRHGLIYDRAKATRRVDAMISHFDATSIRRGQPYASASELPILIVGMPRSGTSLAEQILASHSAVFGAGELAFWQAAGRAYMQAEPVSDLARQSPSGAPPAGTHRVSRIAEQYLERLTALAGGASRVVDKMPANFLYAGLIHAVFPKAKLIHIQRHPIDTCLSIYFHHFYNLGPFANDLDDLAHYYGEYARLLDHWRAVLPATALLEVPYEALLADQQGWTRRMLDFVGLPWDPKCLDFHLTDRVVITASKWQVRQKLDSSSAGRFRNYEKHLGPLRQLTSFATPGGPAS